MAADKTFTELTDYVHPALTNLRYTDPVVKLAAITVTALTSVCIFLSTHVFFSLTSRLYRSLQLKEKAFWNLAVVRSWFGFFCVIVATWAIFADTVLNEDVIYSTCPTSHLAMVITVGFFLFECTALTVSDVYFKTLSTMLQIHHWMSLAGYVIVLMTDTSHMMACRALMLEMSTPFSGLCWTLLKAGKEHTMLWKVNQFLLVHTFHLRNVVEMMLCYISYQHWDNIWNNMPLPLFICVYVQLVLSTAMFTPFWTLKKTRQMICPVDWNFERAEVKVDGDVKVNGVKMAGHGRQATRVYQNGAGYTRLANGSGLHGVKEE